MKRRGFLTLLTAGILCPPLDWQQPEEIEEDDDDPVMTAVINRHIARYCAARERQDFLRKALRGEGRITFNSGGNQVDWVVRRSRETT